MHAILLWRDGTREASAVTTDSGRPYPYVRYRRARSLNTEAIADAKFLHGCGIVADFDEMFPVEVVKFRLAGIGDGGTPIYVED